MSQSCLAHSFIPVNESVSFTCESGGLPLSSCFWARTVGKDRQVVVLQNGVQHDPVDGVDYFSCQFRKPVWFFHLIGPARTFWSLVLLINCNWRPSSHWNSKSERYNEFSRHNFCIVPQPQLFFATNETGGKVLLPQNLEVFTFVSSNENILFVASDMLRNKLYWSSRFSAKIYRFDATDGNNVETLLSTTQCKPGFAYQEGWILAN